MGKLKISEKFNLDDIRAIRDYNAERHLKMSDDEIIAERTNIVNEFLQKFKGEELKSA